MARVTAWHERAIALGVVVLVGWWGSCNARKSGKLEGQIGGWKESAAQLGKLAAQKQKVIAKGRTVYLAAKARSDSSPTPTNLAATAESCARLLLTCDERDSLRLGELAANKKEIEGLRKLKGRSKIFGILPRPVAGAGVCVDERLKPKLCVSVVVPIW